MILFFEKKYTKFNSVFLLAALLCAILLTITIGGVFHIHKDNASHPECAICTLIFNLSFALVSGIILISISFHYAIREKNQPLRLVSHILDRTATRAPPVL